MDIGKFREDFETSGLTQRAYGERVGMSPSMVHYYLRKARQSRASQDEQTNRFKSLQIEVQGSERSIMISTTAGVQINIPI